MPASEDILNVACRISLNIVDIPVQVKLKGRFAANPAIMVAYRQEEIVNHQLGLPVYGNHRDIIKLGCVADMTE